MRIAAAAVMLILIVLVTIEFRHDLRFGPFLEPALHADYTVGGLDLVIPGITKVYDATLTNFGLIPPSLFACEFVTMPWDMEVNLRLQSSNGLGPLKLGQRRCSRQRRLSANPFLSGLSKGKVVGRRLWPGQSLSIGEEATAAGFQNGDVVRLVLFAGQPWSVTSGYPTPGFEIHEQITTTVPLRVRH